MKKRVATLLWYLIFLIWNSSRVQAQELPPPEKFFGFQLGADYKLADWPQIVEYFKILDQSSDKLKLVELGRSTQGNPFVMAIISSEENLQNLDEHKTNARRLADPRQLSDLQAQSIARQGKLIVLVTCSIHATEVGATQASPELAYKLIAEQNPRGEEILNNIVFLLVPGFNPDGLRMVKDWYDKYLETPYEGSRMPWLYHLYTGHDNNRDAFMLTQIESRLVNQVLYHDWFPQVYLDMHQMGSSGPRLFVPPFADPINPNVDPLIYRETAFLGEYIAAALEARGYTGVITGSFFTGYWQGGFLRTAWFHNVVGLLSEMASVRIASPIFLSQNELRGRGRNLPEYRAQSNFPHPWTGGWWRLRNIVEYDLALVYALLEAAAKNRETLLYNFYLKGQNAIKKASEEPPYAFVIPPDQRDPITAVRMLQILSLGGVEIHQADAPFIADEVPYPANSYIILMAQPYRAYAKDLLGPQKYPEIRQYPGGPPVRPYDATGWTLPYQMGVKCIEVTNPFQVDLKKLTQIELPKGSVSQKAKYAYILDHRCNNSFIATNRLLKEGHDIYWVAETFRNKNHTYPRGTMLVTTEKKDIHKMIATLADELSLKIDALNNPPGVRGYKLKPLRLGIYQPWLASMHEGWSRWVLEQYEFPYKNIHNQEIRVGGLKDRYDVIYIPDIWAEGILKGREEGTIPPQFSKGIGTEGLAHLKEFVEQGGTLITMDSSSELVMGGFGLPVANVLKNVKPEEFFCPGSLLKIKLDTTHPVAFGMDSLGVAFFKRSPAFKIIPSFKIDSRVVAKYPRSNLLLSGSILGEKKLYHQAAIVDVPIGKGHVILIGFDALNRAQAHATFKILFNAIYYGASNLVELPNF